MPTIHSRRGFTLGELFAVFTVIAIVCALLLPAIRRARESSRRKRCEDNIKEIGLALLNHENAFGKFPLVTGLSLPVGTTAQTAAPACAIPGPNLAGWSWLVKILPYLEQTNTYSAISQESAGFSVSTGPFTPSLYKGDTTYQHASCVMLPYLICPDWAGDANTHGDTTIDVTAGNPPTGAPEYANVDSSLPGNGNQSFKGKVTPTNYKVIVGTHITNQSGNFAPLENGAMKLTAMGGTRISEITDGTSKTMFVAETKEWGYASWYDGTLNWLATNNPNAALPPGAAGTPNQPPWVNAQSGINVGFDSARPQSRPWLNSGMVSNPIRGNVNWGPSSDHADGTVMHVFGDDHVAPITSAIDPQIYLDLTTRAGGEAVNPAQIR
jgi:type II secretory pathway pseudopilin PulG